MRLAIATPAKDVWSETFIAAHLQGLSGLSLVLSGGIPPRRDGEGLALLPDSLLERARRRIQGGSARALLEQRIAARLRRDRIDVLLAEYGPMGEALAGPCARAGVPLVVHFHGYDAFRNDALAANHRYARLIAGASALVAVSREMEAQLVGLGANPERVHYICYGIDLDRFSIGDPAAQGPDLLAVGRFTDKKAPYLTLLAFARAREQEPAMRLTMAGGGPLLETCRHLARVLGVSDAVHFPGVLGHDEVARRMAASRAFVQHSVVTTDGDREGTPLAVLEAMARGLPVVVTRHAGIADVVEHGHSGLLCGEHDVDTMAANMLRVVREPDLAVRLGRAARARMETHHDLRTQLNALAGVLERAAREGPRPV